jgi:hypothetical protein
MTSKAIDYSNTIIYKLCCNDPSITDVYVGHTTNFTNRKKNHISTYNNESGKRYNSYVYQFIRDHGGWINWSMVEIEKISCANRNDALKNERRYFELLGATLNKQVPSRTNKEYYESHKEHIKEYHESHKEHIKEYRESHKEEIAKRKKEYCESHKEEIAKRNKEYYENENNKKRKKEYDKDRYERLHVYKPKDDSIECDICGGYYKVTHKWQHKNTKKHQKFENVKKDSG